MLVATCVSPGRRRKKVVSSKNPFFLYRVKRQREKASNNRVKNKTILNILISQKNPIV